MAAPFLGKQDFRGYLNYLGSKGDTTAKNYLNFVGSGQNGAAYGVNNPALAAAITGGFNPGKNTIKSYYDKYVEANTPAEKARKIASIYGDGGGGAAPVYAPKLDIAAINAKARKQAEGAVSPFYTKLLNDFLSQQSFNKKQQQSLYDTNVKNIQDTLDQQLETNKLTGERTTQDVAQNEAEIAQNADEFQVDSGQAFDQARLEQAKGSTTGGLGQQKIQQVQAARNTEESRQVQKFQVAKQQQQLFKSRTFEDLSRSTDTATKGAGKAKAAAKFDLDNYIKTAGFTEKNKRNDLELSKQQDITNKAQGYAKDAFNKYITNIANPAQRVAAAQQYGGSF